MRLLRLDLLRYGHLADVSLAFPRAARLHVVLGPNEAGKSTALAAIGDALFGFGHKTDFAFLYETSQLRLGFEVEGADGTKETFFRVKRRKDALLDAAERPVAEAALARLLGGAKRELFQTTYGLNGETLRQGALSLLASGGEAGEALLAGTGLQNLRGALERLDEQAKALAGSRKHNQALSVALEGWKRARDAAEDAAIRPRDWAEARAELEAVRKALDAAHAEAAALRQEESRLRRARLVRPILARLDTQRQDLAELGAVPPLPPDAAATLDRLRAELRQA
uniref:AAA family ATPase n=1 Tax=Falsiroseomonas oryzae TaxID=2766473 RepID=UPI0022EA158E